MSAAELANTFREESADLLVKLEDALLGLESATDDKDLVDTAFRALHTIKGSGSMFGFEAVAGFTHHLENAFDKVRKGEISLNSELIGLALGAIDHIKALIENPEVASSTTGDTILAKVSAITGQSAAAPAVFKTAAASVRPNEDATWRVRFQLAENSLYMGTNPLGLLLGLQELGICTVVPQTDKIPVLEAIAPTTLYMGWDVVLTTPRPRSAIEDVFMFVMDDAQISIEPVVAKEHRLGEILIKRGDAPPEAVNTAMEHIQRLGTVLVKDGVVSEGQVQAALAEQQHVRAEANKAQALAQTQASSIRVPAERLDSLMDQVGELVIAQAHLKQLVAEMDDSPIKSVSEEIERLSNCLRDTTMSIRTVPIGTLFSRFKRLVRDISQELGKDVNLVTTGEETELDKTVIERLNDPLVHIVRNSMDHGIETPDNRAKAGKDRQGHLHLSAIHSGAQVFIRVRDDGKGLDRDRIRAKALENGLIGEEDKLTDQDLYQLIFAPGFSTAKEVTSLSGRGVGMDVVKRTIESLRGSVEVNSFPGHGTEITLHLPLTLAIIDGILVRVSVGYYVIPLSAVEEFVDLTADEDKPNSGRSFLNIRGELVPFIRLREIFNTQDPAELHQKVVIVSETGRRLGLVVDQVLGEHQTVIKSMSPLHANVQTFSGATILGDGSVALILDVAEVAQMGHVPEIDREAS